MHRLIVGAILSLTLLTASAIEITSSLTMSTLSISGCCGVPAGFTTDPSGFSAAQWTDLSKWKSSLTVYDGVGSLDATHSMAGTLAPFTQLRWDYVVTASWSSGLNPDGTPETGFWSFGTCGSPPIGSGCGDRQIYIGEGVGHETFAGTLILSNETPEQFTPFVLTAGAAMSAQSQVPAPVPEPTTGTLMLAGVAVMGALLAASRERVNSDRISSPLMLSYSA